MNNTDYYKRVNGYWLWIFESGGIFSKKKYKNEYKRKWSYTCLKCEERMQVPTKPKGDYYVWNHCIGFPFDNEVTSRHLLCSESCCISAYKRLTEEKLEKGELI